MIDWSTGFVISSRLRDEKSLLTRITKLFFGLNIEEIVIPAQAGIYRLVMYTSDFSSKSHSEDRFLPPQE